MPPLHAARQSHVCMACRTDQRNVQADMPKEPCEDQLQSKLSKGSRERTAKSANACLATRRIEVASGMTNLNGYTATSVESSEQATIFGLAWQPCRRAHHIHDLAAFLVFATHHHLRWQGWGLRAWGLRSGNLFSYLFCKGEDSLPLLLLSGLQLSQKSTTFQASLRKLSKEAKPLKLTHGLQLRVLADGKRSLLLASQLVLLPHDFRLMWSTESTVGSASIELSLAIGASS